MALGSTLAVLRPVKVKTFRNPVRTVAKPLLTPRQCVMAPLLASGRQFKSIAFEMGISEGRAKIIGHEIYKRLGLENRSAFIKWYWTEGMQE
jgi:DNA-binding NarL/FixJ family response regulator